MSAKFTLSRRTMLRGLGVSMALPLLESMAPLGGVASAAEAIGGLGAKASSATAAVPPLRTAFIFLPNGVSVPDWTPATEGAGFELSKTLAPLAKVKDDLLVLSGLAQENARAHGDGGGDHARSAAAFLTGVHPYKTNGKDIKLGISVDQLMANQIGGRTRLPSLELGLDKDQTAGNCDSGYSCAYVTNLSWRDDHTPLPKEVDPASVFDRLFGSASDRDAKESQAKRLMFRKSILDFVADDSARLNRRLGVSDQRKLDEFSTSIREIEKRIEVARIQQMTQKEGPKPADYGARRPEGIPTEISEHMKLMCDMLVLAFQMDVTRISTLMVAHEGSNRVYREAGVTDGHHTVSHHGHDESKLSAIRKIDFFNVTQLAYFLERMKSVKEGNGTLLDHSMIVYGSGISDGDRHSHLDLPILVAGKANGLITPGRHIRYDRGTPLCNLYLSMMDGLGVKAERFGDSTGRLAGLKA